MRSEEVGFHIVGWLNTGLYYNDVGFVLAQVLTLATKC